MNLEHFAVSRPKLFTQAPKWSMIYAYALCALISTLDRCKPPDRCCKLGILQEVKSSVNKWAHHSDLIVCPEGEHFFLVLRNFPYPQLSLDFLELFQLSQQATTQIKFRTSMPFQPKVNEEFSLPFVQGSQRTSAQLYLLCNNFGL